MVDRQEEMKMRRRRFVALLGTLGLSSGGVVMGAKELQEEESRDHKYTLSIGDQSYRVDEDDIAETPGGFKISVPYDENLDGEIYFAGQEFEEDQYREENGNIMIEANNSVNDLLEEDSDGFASS